MKRVLAAQGSGEEVEKRNPEDESPDEEREQGGDGVDRDDDGEVEKEEEGEGKISGWRVFSSLSKQEVSRDLSTRVTFCT